MATTSAPRYAAVATPYAVPRAMLRIRMGTIAASTVRMSSAHAIRCDVLCADTANEITVATARAATTTK